MMTGTEDEAEEELEALKDLGLEVCGGVGHLLHWMFLSDAAALDGQRPIDLMETAEGRARIREALLELQRRRDG
jgi:uncharacterized protein (DUF2384 family)